MKTIIPIIKKEDVKDSVFRFLRSHGIDFETMEHHPIMTVDEGEAIVKAFDVEPCKYLLLQNRHGGNFLLTAPGRKRVDLIELAAQISSSRLSFASDGQSVRMIGCHRGSISVMGLINDRDGAVCCLFDKDLARKEYIICHPSVNTCTIKLRTADLLNIFLPVTNHRVITVALR